MTSQDRARRTFLWSGFVWQLCWSSYWTLFFIRVVVDVDLAPLQLVLLGTAKEATILVVEIPTGLVADLKSRRLSVILGFLVCGVAVVAAGVAHTFPLLIITQILYAAGTTFRSGAETAWFTDELDSVDQVDAVLPRRGRFEAMGSIVGLLAGASLAAVAGLTVALAAVGLLLIAWAVALTQRMPETGFQRHHTAPLSHAKDLLRSGIHASRQPGLSVLLVVSVLAGFASEAVDRLEVARLDEIGFPASIDVSLLIGTAVILQSLATIAVLFIFESRLKAEKLVTAMLVLRVTTAMAVIVLARADLLVIAVAAMIATGTVRNVARTVTVAWTNRYTDRSNRATVHSFVGQATSLGEISGGIVLGVVAQRSGIPAALAASAAIWFASGVWARRSR